MMPPHNKLLPVYTLNNQYSVTNFLNLLDEQKINYVWIHGDKNVNLGDIDIAVGKKDFEKIQLYSQKCAFEIGYRFLQVLQHEYCAKYFILGRIIDGHIEYMIPDICSDYVRNGRVLIKAEKLLFGRVFSDDFYKCNLLVEAEYIFLKRSLKETWGESHLKDFRNIFLAKKNELLYLLKKYLNNNLLMQFENVIENNNLESLNNISTFLKNSILFKTLLQNPFGYFYYKNKNLIRIIKRIRKPNGLVIAVIGTDGSGKSTVIKNLTTTLSPAFRRVKNYHWKPELFGDKESANVIVTEPHKKPPRSFIISVIKLLYYIGQYLFGYLLKIYPKKIKSTLVVFDRYYYDMIVDQKRFRMKLSPKIIQLFLPIIPEPDLVFLLKTDAPIALKRKNELPVEEIERQNKEFLSLAKTLKGRFYIIDNNSDVDTAVLAINSIVFQFLEKRLTTE